MKRRLLSLVLLYSCSMASSSPALAEPKPWAIDKEKSYVRFAAGLFGSKIRGQFTAFEADIRLDPDQLEESSITVRVDPVSISTRNDERDAELRNANWFDVGTFADIRFETERIEKTSDGYQATGSLTILDVTRSMTVPFEFTVSDGDEGRIGSVSGSAILKRTEFGLGKGKWGKTSVVRDDVEVEVALQGLMPTSE